MALAAPGYQGCSRIIPGTSTASLNAGIGWEDAEAWLQFIARDGCYVLSRGMICCAMISTCAISYL
jgi:hypothetical protein